VEYRFIVRNDYTDVLRVVTLPSGPRGHVWPGEERSFNVGSARKVWVSFTVGRHLEVSDVFLVSRDTPCWIFPITTQISQQVPALPVPCDFEEDREAAAP
jgi:hypothetical protein